MSKYKKGYRKLHKRVKCAIDLACSYGDIAGGHHKMWVIDQMVRILAGDQYTEVIKAACDGQDGPHTYDWDTGIAP